MRRLEDELSTVHSGAVVQVRERLAVLVGEHFGADMCAGMSIREHEGKAYYCNVGMHSTHDTAHRAWRKLTSVAPVGHGASWKQTLASRREIGRFVGIEQLPYDLRSSPLFEHIYRPYGFHHQLRMLVMNGNEFAGWVGLLRCKDRPDWTIRERRALASLAPSLQTMMMYDPTSPLGVAGDVPQTLVLCPEGKVDYAGEGAAMWLTQERRSAIAARVRRIDIDGGTSEVVVIDGVEVRLLRVCGDNRVRYTAMLNPLPRLELGAMAQLSPRQFEVALAAAKGASPAGIADDLGITAETVRGYIKEIYRCLGVRSRVELAERMRN